MANIASEFNFRLTTLNSPVLLITPNNFILATSLCFVGTENVGWKNKFSTIVTMTFYNINVGYGSK